MSYLSDEDYDFIYSQSPRVCVDMVIKSANGEILLTKRSIEPYRNYWHLPGGRIRFRETVQDAIKRIIKGELGIDFNGTIKQLGFCEFLEEEQKGQPRHSISLVHEIILSDRTEIHLDETSQDVKSFNELPSLMIPSQKYFLINQGYK